MDANVQRLLNDKLYDKRKVGALELERVIRDLVASKDYNRVEAILEQLCNEYAYAVHQPHARNGGLIGLAAAGIALGSELARYLAKIVPPVLACFTDQDARVRYYACEAMYNIAKVAKGEILIYFNNIFDALCKLGADSELSVKNGAELLDRLVKDIVSESAASYVSVLETEPEFGGPEKDFSEDRPRPPTAFSLQRFIPLLKDRIWVINPFTRQFLVGWITLLDSIPDLEIVTFLPDFLAGLLKFLSDTNKDVQVATQACLNKFLNEIKRISRVKKGLAESKKSREGGKRKREDSVDSGSLRDGLQEGDEIDSQMSGDDDDASAEEDWVPGQDVHINYREILDILTATLDSPLEDATLPESLRWIVEFLDICPEEVLPFTPKVLAHMLPAMASGSESIRQAAVRVNSGLLDYVVSLSDEPDMGTQYHHQSRLPTFGERPDGTVSARASLSSSRELDVRSPTPAHNRSISTPSAVPSSAHPQADLDYAAAVSALTLLFLNDHEATRVAALTWLIMLHRKAPRKVLAFNDGTFPALLKTLSDPAEAVVTKDLQLLSQISRNSEDDYFSNFMVNLLQLFATDRKLLETRGNLIIRQLCVSLSAERIYRTLADCIEKEEDVEFASIMVQILNNNLITAPELADLRKRLRNLETKLLEPEKFPYLYKCLYGLLMLLPQSSAFAALKNRLNSVSSIGYLHITPRPTASTSAGANFDRPNRLKGREEAIVKWGDLLEKFRSVQEKARRTQRHAGEGLDDGAPLGVGDIRLGDGPEMKGGSKDTRNMPGPPVPMKDPSTAPPPVPPAAKRSGLGRQLGRFGGAVAGRGKRP
ncbi:hypothetical protein ACHAP1_006600 [Verticillium nonalfalfae]